MAHEPRNNFEISPFGARRLAAALGKRQQAPAHQTAMAARANLSPKRDRGPRFHCRHQIRLEEIRRPAVGCFVAGTLVHTKDSLKPIEQIQVGDWVLSRPENPVQGTETGYKRVSKTFRFENKEVVTFCWSRSDDAETALPDMVYVTPNHPTWWSPLGTWCPIGRLRISGDGEWFERELVLADGACGLLGEVMDLYRTDQPHVAFEDEGWGSPLGTLIDFSGPEPKVVDHSLLYDDETWGDPEEETRERFITTVYNLEVEDWHTYFVGRTGLWVHNANCFEPVLEVAEGKGNM